MFLLFNSYIFIFMFLPFTFFVYFYLNHKKLTQASKAFLLFSSLFFYAWWNPIYLPLILSSMLFNYVLGNALSKATHKITKKEFHKKTLLTFGIISNLALLSYFKYTDFFISNLNLLSHSTYPLLHLALPLAISFYTFQQIAYLVDSYRQETSEYDFLNYAVFVTFFPQLIAGPIVHHSEMMPQFAKVKNKVINYKNISMGLFIFSIGLFKKAVIADTFATWANVGFDVAQTLNLFAAWATSLSYTFQLYFDFSGYTDMAIGAALLFNIKLPINFNSPYKATSIQDFWRRWHITLSRFLKDYIYIPLGGNRQGEIRTYTNLIATFLIGGIWHGAGWTFVFWGLLHGIGLVINHIWNKLNIHLPKVLAWFITFNFINITWVFFRAKNFDDALKVLGSMFSLNDIVLSPKLGKQLTFLHDYNIKFTGVTENLGDGSKILNWILIGFFIILFLKNSNQKMENFRATYLNVFTAGILFILGALALNKVSDFLYYNF